MSTHNQSGKRIRELNAILSSKLVDKGVEASSEETTTELVNKIKKIMSEEDVFNLLNRTITDIIIPDTVTNIGGYAFYDCKDLTDIVLPDGVTNIGNYAFYGCTSIIKADMPNVTKIGERAFYGCTYLAQVNFPNVEYLGDCFLYGTGVTECTVPPSYKGKIGTENADPFVGVKKLIVDCKTMGYKFTYENKTITDLILTNNVKTVSYFAMLYSTAIKYVYLPSSIKSIDSRHGFVNGKTTEVVELEQGFNANLNISASTLYSVETLVAMFEALADLTGQTAKTLTIGATNLAKLTDEQKAIAINKNWTLA
jgi:hypothetical protein